MADSAGDLITKLDLTLARARELLAELSTERPEPIIDEERLRELHRSFHPRG